MAGLLDKRTLLRTAFLVVLSLLVVGCGGNANLTKANYDKLKEGMPQQEVEAILGKGRMMTNAEVKQQSGTAAKGVNMFKWGDDNKYIMVEFTFDNDPKLMNKWEKGL